MWLVVFRTNLLPKLNWSFAAHPYLIRPEGIMQENSYKSERWSVITKSWKCNFLLHLFISDQDGNVPILRRLGLIRNFSFQINTQKYSVGMLVDGMRPLFSSGIFIYVGWREPESGSGRVIFSYLFLTGIDRFYYSIEQGQPCLTLPFSPKSLKRVLISN